MSLRNPATDTGIDDAVDPDVSMLSKDDIYLFKEGSHFRLYEKLGAHIITVDGREGTVFGVWAPNAETVSVIGDFNGWDHQRHVLVPRGDSGIWEGFIAGVGRSMPYKYVIQSSYDKRRPEKADSFAVHGEVPPKTASVIWDLPYDWGDENWMTSRAQNY